VTSRIIPSFHRFLQYQPKSASDPDLEKVWSDFHHQLAQFTQEMDATGPHLTQKSI
jgi:glutathione S-transferase